MSIAAVAVLCVIAISLAYGPAELSYPISVQLNAEMRDGDMLFALNARADEYRQSNQQEKAESQQELIYQKLIEMAPDYLGINVSTVHNASFFPLATTTETNSSPLCGSMKDIPVHFKEVRSSAWFQTFAEKYSNYSIELILQDERLRQSKFHYGFIASSGDNDGASTYFHVDTCTKKITDSENYRLRCFGDVSIHDPESPHYDPTLLIYYDTSSNYDDTIASIHLDEFCTIPRDSWRQWFYVYARDVDRMEQQMINMGQSDEYESLMTDPQYRKFYLLRSIAYSIASNVVEYDEIQADIQNYCTRYGSLPDDFAALVKVGGIDRQLSAC